MSFPDRAQVVVIGGGAIGTSTAYHLTKLGFTDVVVIEQGRLSSGTTWHAAGIVGQIRSSAAMTELARYSIELYQSLEAETGFATGWRQCGALWVAQSEERMVHLKRAISQARWFGSEADFITGAQAAEYLPQLNVEGLVGAAWLPADGIVNPTDLTQSLARGATSRGARIFERTKALEILTTAGRVHGVRTDAGTIEAEIVVLAAGQWTKALADSVGVTAPLHPAQHFYVVSEQIDGIGAHTPILRDPDAEMYFKPEVGGLVAGSFERNAMPWVRSADIPYPFEFRLLDENWEHFAPLLERAIIRVPALGEVGLRKLYNGPESFTPDNQFLLGETPEIAGLFVGAGFNSGGIANAGGAGVALAEWIVSGEPQRNLQSVDIARFAPFAASDRWLRKRTIETLGDHYALPYPGREPITGRGIRRSPLHELMKSQGAWFGTKFGWERPLAFAPDKASGLSPVPTFGRPDWLSWVEREYRAVRESVAVFDRSTLAKFLVSGPDALAALQFVCSADLDVPVGTVVRTLCLGDDATIRADLVIRRIAETEFMVFTGTGEQRRDVAYLRRTLPAELSWSLVDVTSAYAVIYLAGPKSRELLSAVSHAPLGAADLPIRQSRTIDIGDSVADALRMSYAGGLGFELVMPTDYAAAVYETLVEAGAGFGLLPAGTHALEAARISAGRTAWGHELTPSATPFDVGLMSATKLQTELDFRGRAALEQAAQQPSVQRVVRLHVTADDPAVHLWGGEVVSASRIPVGTVASVSTDFDHGGFAALALVGPEVAGEITVDAGPAVLPAQLVKD